MSKNKNTKSIVITIVITVIVLGCLTFAAMQFLVPAYMNANAGQSSLKNKIYETAVKVFPLLVGIVLIVIASMIANSRNEEDEEVDDEDKLPPNSYDKQMFEAPSDDPSAAKPAAPADKAPEQKKESFFEIFETHEKPAEPVQEEPQPVVAEPEPVVEQPVEPEPEPEPEAEPVIVPSAPVAPTAPAADAPVVDAIYALIRKLDDLTDMMTVEEEDEEEEVDDQDDYEYYADQEQEEQEEQEGKIEQGEERISHIEDKLDKLCEVVGNLAAAISTQHVAAPKVEKPAKPVTVTEVKKVEVPVEIPVDKKLNDINPEDPMQRAKIEFDSAKECFYDITFAFTGASVEKAQKALPESAYVLKINGKTVVIVPFLDKAEAESELDKIGAKYESVFVNADDQASFDEVISSRL